MITPNSDIAQNCKKLPLPVGISSYIHICSKCYCVDKTLLIKEILDQESLVTLFTRPRRFGKTLNMDMLKVFFEKTNEDTSIYFKDKKSGVVEKNIKNIKASILLYSLLLKMLNFRHLKVYIKIY